MGAISGYPPQIDNSTTGAARPVGVETPTAARMRMRPTTGQCAPCRPMLDHLPSEIRRVSPLAGPKRQFHWQGRAILYAPSEPGKGVAEEPGIAREHMN